MKSFQFRKAVAADVGQIFGVLKSTWPEQDTDQEQVLKALKSSSHSSFVTILDERIVGFVDGFMTTSFDGDKRWEVDLLAVHPSARGKRIGQELVNQCVQAGIQRKADYSRAGIQINNKASQYTFQRIGFQMQPQISRIMVSSKIVNGEERVIDGLHLIPVDTMNYSGLWIENNLSYDGLLAAQIYQSKREYALAGAVIPNDLKVEQEAARDLGFEEIDEYQWWFIK
ncbi:MAG: GNAT family N-acetyltransferase [Anaerolineaceae bacterium]|nr:GNAT family N-acetyltransferase [Anaerolineaceae bacterium]